jgi:hypothetical protein
MQQPMDLIELYKSMLAEAWLEADNEGFIHSARPGRDREPYHISKKRVVLPTFNQLSVPEANNRIFFHPLMENQLRGESTILADYRERVNERLNVTIWAVAKRLMQLATSPAEHPNLRVEQTEFLTPVKDADNGTLERMEKIMKAMPLNDPSKCFVHIYIKRGGTIKGTKHVRVGIVSFPLYEELARKPEGKGKNEVWGIPMRAKDREIMMAFLRYLLPGLDQPEYFNRSSDSMVAPSLEAFMATVTAIGDPINAQVELFESYFKDSNLLIGGDWVDVLKDTQALLKQIRAIPMQSGNEGSSPQTSGPQAIDIRGVPVPTASPQAAKWQQQQQQQAQAPAPAPVAPVNKPPERLGAVYAEVKKEQAAQPGGLILPSKAPAPSGPPPVPPAQRQPEPAPVNPHNPYGVPQFPGYNAAPQPAPTNPYQAQYVHHHPGTYAPPQPVYGMPPPQQGQIARGPGGIDVNSMFQSRPDLAARAGYVPPGYAPPGYPGGPQMQQPRWAQPVYQQPYQQYGQPQPQQYYGGPPVSPYGNI